MSGCTRRHDDAETVDDADDEAEQDDAGADRDDEVAVAVDHAGGEHGEQADHRADREIDTAGQDGQRLPQRHQGQIGRLLIDVEDVPRGAEAVGDGAAEDADHQDEDDNDAEADDLLGHPAACRAAWQRVGRWHSWRGLLRRRPGGPWVARSMTVSSVMLPVSSSPVMTPSRMT